MPPLQLLDSARRSPFIFLDALNMELALKSCGRDMKQGLLGNQSSLIWEKIIGQKLSSREYRKFNNDFNIDIRRTYEWMKKKTQQNNCLITPYHENWKKIPTSQIRWRAFNSDFICASAVHLNTEITGHISPEQISLFTCTAVSCFRPVVSTQSSSL